MNEEPIKELVNRYIKELYTKSGRVSKRALKKHGLPENISVNWGDLKCVNVSKRIVIDIEEASPGEQRFKNYIYERLKKGYWKHRRHICKRGVVVFKKRLKNRGFLPGYAVAFMNAS
jgi:hypothetical protein